MSSEQPQKSPMLLVQPLKLDEINLKIDDQDDFDEKPDQTAAVTPIDVIDDVELLAILGLPTPTTTTLSNEFPPTSTTATSATDGFLASPPRCNTPALTDENVFLDWDDMPELSEGEEEPENTAITPNGISRKRKSYKDDDIFAELDFEDAILYPTTTTTTATTGTAGSNNSYLSSPTSVSLQPPPTKKRFIQDENVQLINISNAL